VCAAPFALLLLLAPLSAIAQTEPQEVVATVNGAPIYSSELPIQAKIAALRRQEYDAKVDAAREMAAKRVIEKAAAAKGQTLEQFLAAEVDDKVGEPSDQELRGFYVARQSDFGPTFEASRDQVRNTYRQLRLQQLRSELGQKLFANVDIRIVLTPPRTKIDFGTGPMRGASTAPVTIVEFSDFQCPFCKNAVPTINKIREKYGDKVQWMYKDFPLTEIHPQAQAAAEAAHCAEEQGKFWEYHDALFGIAPNFSTDAFITLAGNVGVKNPEAFRACVDERKYKSRVDEGTTLGQTVGVDGTPMFFINGIALSGAAPLPEFEKIIDGELPTAK
jgi:protein-disulfide isomerase